MPWALHAAIMDSGDHEIKVRHIFYGETKEECDDYFKEHLGTCSYFRSAEKSREVISWFEEIDELPTPESCNAEAEASEGELEES